MAIVTGIALLAGGFVVFWIVRRSLRPLDRVAATARQVSTLPLDRGEVDLGVRVPERDTDTRTEVGQVGAALNQMLGHVSNALVARQASEMRVRQFVADASHELRTPLAAIRGYAELARREEDDTEGVAHALRRVESESARMTTLVDDLLLLARLDSGRPLSAEEVDLTMLVGRRRLRRPGRRARPPLAAGPAGGTGDHDRRPGAAAPGAGQPAGQRPHPHPGRDHRAGAACGPDRDGSVVTVTDNGPGIPDAAAAGDLQPVRPGRLVAVASGRLDRSRPGHRRGRRRGARRLGVRPEPARTDHLHRAAAARRGGRADRHGQQPVRGDPACGNRPRLELIPPFAAGAAYSLPPAPLVARRPPRPEHA